MLSITNLHVSVDQEPILKGLSLIVQPGTVHALMGPNGSGKSTLAHTLMGNPLYQIQEGQITFKNTDLSALTVDKRARLGLFLAFQHPLELPGVSVATFLKEALQACSGTAISVQEFTQRLSDSMKILSIDDSFAQRSLNAGFSGGEKKRLEILQMLMLKPDLVILDEIDSGLDIDALKLVAAGIVQAQQANPTMSIIIITHYQRILDYVIPDYVHIVHQGALAVSGSLDLVRDVEAKGYDAFK